MNKQKKIDEDTFKKLVKPHILRGRPGDWRHSKRVVFWVKKLGKDREDLSLLIKAAYLHDIGWRDVLPNKNKITKKELFSNEKHANANTKPYITNFLKDSNHSIKEINTIVRIINAVDTYKSNKVDEKIVVDSDNLSKLCIEHLEEKYQKSDWDEIIKLWDNTMQHRIKTKLGKEIFPDLLKILKEDIQLT
ncbi:MAG: HD domain-containing protein [Candidatus Pacebacteria bacterium]|jgi:HD superfamily phosphodiesterase|nr:HD domain-containing protein [Candidatus Paceibacterota bacterium]MBT4652824.1 HD domain-containing protein [Candidatus Paceibacterota bacterium]